MQNLFPDIGPTFFFVNSNMTLLNLLGVAERCQAFPESWVELDSPLVGLGVSNLKAFILPWPWADPTVGLGRATPERHPSLRLPGCVQTFLSCPLPGGSVWIFTAMAGFLLGSHSTPFYPVTK